MMRATILLILVCISIMAVWTAAAEEAARASPSVAAGSSDPSLLQAGATSKSKAKAHVYNAAAARASLHAGERAGMSRFDEVTQRVGIEVPVSARHLHKSHRQNHRREREQQVMLSVVEKVLGKQEHEEASKEAAARDGSMEDEFHLLNALMEKQSEMREYSEHSNEKEAIAGVSRKFLRDVTDSAIKNALHRLHKQHPHSRVHSRDPVHVYGVRSPYNGPQNKRHKKYDMHSEEALNDPYLSRNSFVDVASHASGFASRSHPQVVYRLGKHDSALLAEREVARNREYSATHAHRRSHPTPKPRKRAASKPAAAAAHPADGAVHFNVQQPHKPAGAAFLETDVAFQSLQKAYVAEMEAHALESEKFQRPWYVHSHPDAVAESETASQPLHQLYDQFAPHVVQQEEESVLLELENEMRAQEKGQAQQMPLKELGILLGLNMEKRNTAPQHPEQKTPEPQKQQQKVPVAQPRFTQVKHKTKGMAQSGAAASHVLGALASAGAKEDGGGDDLEAMVNAGEAYRPSTLKHPPPPPVPPPPPPPPPPKFSE